MQRDNEETRKAVLREVGVGEVLTITDSAKLLRLLAEPKDDGDPEKRDLIEKAEQLEERGIK